MDQTYLYEVRPHRIITGIHGVPYIRSPRSVYLTKDEVLICLKNGSVYRRFANLDKLERVTVTNVDRLHNENFISEEEWKKESTATKVEETPVVEEVKQEEPVVEEVPAPVEEEPIEEVVEEDSKVDKTAPVEVTEESVEVEEAEEEVAEEESDDSVVEEKVDEAPQQNNNSVQFKNHHKKHKK